MIWHRITHVAKLIVLGILFILTVGPEWPAFGDEAHRLNGLIKLRQFDFLVWELNAIGSKGEAALASGHPYLSETTRHDIALDFLEQLRAIRQLEVKITRFYIDPAVANPDAGTAALQAELAQERAALTQIQPYVEAIVQDQVAAVLADEGFQVLGQAWPPVMMHVTSLPHLLIVSPRDHIERRYGIPLVNGLTTPEKEALETAVFEELNLSALVVPLGGLGTYPAMIEETSNVNRLAEVVAHEWAHHWLTPYPSTLQYTTSGQARTINETIASIVGKEIGPLVVERFYPDQLPPPQKAAVVPPPPDPDVEPPFDFRAEMAETRITADRLLAEGKIEAAEAYMEERRQLFVAHGYLIRKLNQAYFAFHGAYADEPGEAGSDPIGPTLLQIRQATPSLRAFMKQVAPASSYEELKRILESLSSN